MYYLLTEKFKSQEAELVEIILQAVPAEKIFLLGSSLEQQRTESIFMTDAPSCRKVGHYWLLVLMKKDCGYSTSYVQDKIENNCQHFVPVTAIVLHTDRFSDWISEGHRFAHTVLKIAVLLHDNGSLPLPAAGYEEADNKITEGYYCTNKVNEFIAGADLYRAKKQNGMAAFMLHQAAEQVLHTLFKKETGLHINTHNIDKLLRYCTMVNYQLPAVFPKEKEADRRLLKLLQRAYIEARYKDDFAISNSDLLTIKERIEALQGIVLT